MAMSQRSGVSNDDEVRSYTVPSGHKAVVGLGSESAEIVIRLGDIELVVEGASLRRSGVKRGRTTLSDLMATRPSAAPRNIADISTDDRDYFDSIGPWVRGNVVAQKFGKTLETIGNYRKSNRMLGVGFGETKLTYYYPVQQFRNGNVIPGLKRVLDALEPGFVSAASRAGWLAARAYEETDESRWSVLGRGEVELVVSWAKEDAERLTAA